jgi:hypothetical protein
VPRAVQELMRTLERVRPKLKLSPGPPPRGAPMEREKGEGKRENGETAER